MTPAAVGGDSSGEQTERAESFFRFHPTRLRPLTPCVRITNQLLGNFALTGCAMQRVATQIYVKSDFEVPQT